MIIGHHTTGHQSLSSAKWYRVVMVGMESLIGLRASAGGIGLMINGLGMPRDQLEGTPFESYVIPGLILAAAVGGSMAVAAWTAWRPHPHAALASLGAGAILVTWIAVQVAMLGYLSWLQPVMFLAGLTVMAAAWRWRVASRR
ncbi:MAG: hypothetical protein KatS3mg059_0336 [Thermomicrobiales bacterium]|nr:MAG: hypothetical protein KatS3mg059_0336 [Thermomicrobiales bacterium]